MRPLRLLVLLAACNPAGDGAAVDGSVAADAGVLPDGRIVSSPDARPLVDAWSGPDAFVAACDTVTGDRTIANGDAVTTCLSTDSDVDTYRFTAPVADRAGGTLRVRIDYDPTVCQLNFKAWIDADAQYSWASANQSYSNPTNAQLDHHFIGLVWPGSGYTLRVMKRLPFAGTCPYTLTTSYVALDDPYEPNQEVADFKPLTIGQTLQTYMACISPDRSVYPGDCEDSYTLALPVGSYNLSWTMTSGPNINPCLSVYCRDTSVSPAVVTHDEFNCHAANYSSAFYSSFNVTRPSQCYVHLHGSSAGGMYGAYTSPTLPSAMRGTSTKYSLSVIPAP